MSEEKLEQLERDLQSIKKHLDRDFESIRQRNARVEADKAWEVSATRIGIISLITYFVSAAMLYLLGARQYWLNALIPVFGFYLSAQSLPAIKRLWLKSIYHSVKLKNEVGPISPCGELNE